MFCVLRVSVSTVLCFGGFYFSFQRFSFSFNIVSMPIKLQAHALHHGQLDVLDALKAPRLKLHKYATHAS